VFSTEKVQAEDGTCTKKCRARSNMRSTSVGIHEVSDDVLGNVSSDAESDLIVTRWRMDQASYSKSPVKFEEDQFEDLKAFLLNEQSSFEPLEDERRMWNFWTVSSQSFNADRNRRAGSMVRCAGSMARCMARWSGISEQSPAFSSTLRLYHKSKQSSILRAETTYHNFLTISRNSRNSDQVFRFLDPLANQ
jgi:hypothetical protein